MACRSIHSSNRQHWFVIDMVNVPLSFALGSAFDHFAVRAELDHTLVIADPTVENPCVDQLLDGFGFHGGWLLVGPKGSTPFAGQIADKLEAEFFIGQRVNESVSSESPFVLATMLEDDLASKIELDDGVNVPSRAGTGHRIVRPQSSPTKMEALFVPVDVLEREVRMLGVEERQPQLAIAATFVDEVLSGFKGPFVLGDLWFGHILHSKDTPDTWLERPARVVWPENRAVAFVLLAVEQIRWIAHDPVVGVQE